MFRYCFRHIYNSKCKALAWYLSVFLCLSVCLVCLSHPCFTDCHPQGTDMASIHVQFSLSVQYTSICKLNFE